MEMLPTDFKLGSWVSDLDNYGKKFQDGIPYPHVLINDFFDLSYAEYLHKNFLTSDNKKILSYNNPIEKKLVIDNFESEPIFFDLFEKLNSSNMLSIMQKLTSINNLEKDPTLHGAGLHLHARGGKLDLHLDYSIHPILKKERRINLIIYMNKDWNVEWGGGIELWSKNNEGFPLEKKSNISPMFNSAVIFQTSDDSIHGLPTPIKCPEGIFRKSIAIYYISQAREGANPRQKAVFMPLPGQIVPEGLRKLYDIRSTQRITQEDLNTYFPDWESHPAGKNYWYE